MTADFLREKFNVAAGYAAYLATGTAEQRRRWNDVDAKVLVTPAQQQLLGGFARVINVLAISGIWCGDCVAQGPMLCRIAQAHPAKINLRWLDRDLHKDLADKVQLCGGHRVPTVIFLAEDYEWCSLLGDRTLSRYRAIAARQLGASCPVGLVPPGDEELAETMQDWVDEFERVQLMLRLSPRLRQKHGD